MTAGLIGQTLGQYHIRMLLGKGGMSTVYLAYQPSMDRTVAVKVLPREFLHDDTFLQRFQQEVRTIARLEHLHILPVYDVGEDQGIPFLVMRYLSGGTLSDRIAARLPGLGSVVRLASQVADALDYAHERGIVHRDLKPSNILMDQAGNAYLADFGIARVQEAASVTTGERVIGTPPYIAPEMVRKGEAVTGSVDVYALGIITFEMLTGEPPYLDEDPMKTLMAHVLEPVPSVRSIDPNISPAVDAVLRRCLAKSPAERYPTAGAFARDLARAAEMAYPTVQVPPLADQIAADAEVYYPDSEPAGSGRVPPRWRGCLLPAGIVLALLLGMIVTASVMTGGKPFSLLGLPSPAPTRTQTPTATQPSAASPSPTDTLTSTDEPATPTATPVVLPLPGGGGRLAFASDRDGDYEIFVIDLDGGNLRQLTSNNAFDFDPAWSPDGRWIVFASTADGDSEIVVMDGAGNNVRQFTDNTGRDADPAWSPDGEWIAFSSDRDGDFDIYIMRPDGSDVRQITHNETVDDLTPTWSPDGARLAYYVKTGVNETTSELYMVDIDGGDPVRLTDNAVLDQWPDWSPDGSRLVFTSARDEPPNVRSLFTLSAADGQVTRLVSTGSHDDDPAWSPDGTRVAFDSDRDGDGHFDLFIFDIISGELRQLTFTAANDVAPAWQPLP